MSVLKDIIDTVKDIGVAGTIDDYFKKKQYSSIAKRSLEGTLQFPNLVSRSIDINTLQMVNKAQERNFASFVQITLTMNPFLKVDKEKDVAGYLRQFHQNSDIKTDFHDVMNGVSDIIQDNYQCFTNDEESKFIITSIYEGSTNKLIATNKEQLKSVLESIIKDKLNDKYVPKRNYIYNFANESLSKHYNQIVKEDLNGQKFNYQQQQDAISNDLNERKFNVQQQNDSINNMQRNAQINYQMSKDDKDFNYRKNQDAIKNNLEEKKFNAQQPNDTAKNKWKPKDMDVTLVPQNILKDNDVKKSNELVPTTLHIRINTLDKDGNNGGYFDCIIGVKATMHPIDSNEMVTNLVNACKNNNKFFDFIRWTSGEISFFKDFLFDIGQIKDDVVDRSTGASPWWITLKRRKALSKIKDVLHLPSQILPNSSIVISMDEVQFIKSQYGFDLMNILFVNKIMQTYFLISFVIVDNSTQTVNFLYDGQTTFQTVTFTGLERENSNHANDFKEMLKLINRY